LNGNTFRILEFEAVRRLLLGHVGSAAGRARVQALRPHQEAGAVREALARTSEGVALLAAVGRQPYHDLPDLREVLAAARVEGTYLEPAALLDVASFIEGSVEISRRVTRVDAAPALAHLAGQVADPSDVAAAIRRAVLPTREVADDASPRLLELRRSLTRLRAQLQ
jgi:DNA mismatch repair protein MutS2